MLQIVSADIDGLVDDDAMNTQYLLQLVAPDLQLLFSLEPDEYDGAKRDVG
jgi:hypothetical protein